MTDTLARYAKAVVAFLTPALPLLLQAMDPKSPGRTDITPQEWLLAIGASLAAAGLVALTPNKKPKRPENPQPNWRDVDPKVVDQAVRRGLRRYEREQAAGRHQAGRS